MFFLMTLKCEEEVDDSNVINLVAYGGDKIKIWVNCQDPLDKNNFHIYSSTCSSKSLLYVTFRHRWSFK